MSGYTHEMDHARTRGRAAAHALAPAGGGAARRGGRGDGAARATRADGREDDLRRTSSCSPSGSRSSARWRRRFEGVALDRRGCVVVDAATRRTGNAKVYAGGDCINGGKEVVNAVADGREAARAMMRAWASTREQRPMADLSIDMCGIKSPNPFWLASAPPANTGDQVMRAFDAGWGGAVWKTLGNPIVNVSSRFGASTTAGKRMMGFNNIELITDRPWRSTSARSPR
jgi:hypothetical protein